MAGIFLRSRRLCLNCAHGNLTPAKISGNFDCLFTPYRFSIEHNCIARGGLA